MNNDEKEQLFLLINGPLLLATRRIFNPQQLTNGIRFCIFKNKLGCNEVRIVIFKTS